MEGSSRLHLKVCGTAVTWSGRRVCHGAPATTAQDHSVWRFFDFPVQPAMRPPDRLGGRAARGPLPSGTPSTRIRGAGRRTRGSRIRPGGMVVSGHGGVREAARRRRYVRWGARGARRCRRRRGWSRGGSGAGSGGRLLTSSPCRSGARPGTRQRRRRRARRGPRPAAGPTGTSRGLASSPPISADRGRGRGKRARQRGAQVNELGGHAATGRIRRSFPRSRGGRCGTTPGSTGRTAKWCRCSSCKAATPVPAVPAAGAVLLALVLKEP